MHARIQVNIPVNPLSKNIFYQYTKDEILTALKDNELIVEKIDDFSLVNGENIFFSVEGKKQ